LQAKSSDLWEKLQKEEPMSVVREQESDVLDARDRQPQAGHVQEGDLHELFHQLVAHTLSPHQAIACVKGWKTMPIEALEDAIVSQQSAYIRLCCAWILGEVQHVTHPLRLIEAYHGERDGNVRANIVWALSRMHPESISPELYRTLLSDDCYHVPLVALRYLAYCPALLGTLDFLPLYRQARHPLVQAELLRAIRTFQKGDNDLPFLTAELWQTTNPWLVGELLLAIATIHAPDSLSIILDYWNEHQDDFVANEYLAFQFASCCAALCQSRPCTELERLYLGHDCVTLRAKIIEALASAGGPDCLHILQALEGREHSPPLRGLLRQAILMIDITIV
jgi:hypothetical protein